jgi:glycosyltransferase involved in cell wall biosynthesis
MHHVDRPIRALVLANALDRSERHILAGLHDRGVALTVMMDTRHEEEAAFLRGRGVPTEHLVCRSRVDPAAARAIRARLREGSFDVMHGLINRPLANGLWAAWGMKGLRRVAYRGTEGHISRFDPAAWMTYLHPRLDRIVCVSAGVKFYLSGFGIPERKLVVIHKGHDPSWYTPAPRRALEALGIPRDAFVVCCVANVRPVKGVEYLIGAWQHLAADSPAHLLLIGEVRDAKVQRLLETSPSRDRLHAVGFRSDAAALLGASDLAAMVSVEREGLPRAIMEAQAQGVAALVTRVGGMPEVVIDGYNGWVVEPRDAEAIAAAMTVAMTDRDELAARGRNARERFAREFSIAATIDKTLALYRDLVATGVGSTHGA